MTSKGRNRKRNIGRWTFSMLRGMWTHTKGLSSKFDERLLSSASFRQLISISVDVSIINCWEITFHNVTIFNIVPKPLSNNANFICFALSFCHRFTFEDCPHPTIQSPMKSASSSNHPAIYQFSESMLRLSLGNVYPEHTWHGMEFITMELCIRTTRHNEPP